MPEEVNRFYLNIFINLLREHFSPYSYSIGKPQDSSVCLGTENGYWIVYGCNRIARMDEKRFMTVVEAAMEMLSRLCCNEEEEISVKSGFLMSIYHKATTDKGNHLPDTNLLSKAPRDDTGSSMQGVGTWSSFSDALEVFSEDFMSEGRYPLGNNKKEWI